ncbi:hypothetical protein GCM10007380_15020 [Gottfriedia solisilvae]|uniref:Uncharacterized protein n=1 Tax=Gottfriedia solisilvae TaxID=1516104 RepID=A0A8J3EXH5_9BACI|nr:hypothetical protein GCM10007380_15020 [Gottfriedia solisilvae]
MKLYKKLSFITILFLILTGCEFSLNSGKSLDTSDLEFNSMSAGTVYSS